MGEEGRVVITGTSSPDGERCEAEADGVPDRRVTGGYLACNRPEDHVGDHWDRHFGLAWRFERDLTPVAPTSGIDEDGG